jgi:hypothetical protein
MRIPVQALALAFYATGSASATSVFVHGTSAGQGLARAHGRECFVITAAQILGTSATADVINAAGKGAVARLETLLGGDVAVLRLVNREEGFCPLGQEAAARVPEAVLKTYRTWYLDYTGQSGAVNRFALAPLSFGNRYIALRPKQKRPGLEAKLTGSPVYADGLLIGLLQEVETDSKRERVARVRRIQELELLMDGFFAARSVPAPPSADRGPIDENFAAAKLALDQHRNCEVALASLQAVSDSVRQEPSWSLYAARAHECLGDQEAALAMYRAYDKLAPGRRDIAAKIASLDYARRTSRNQEQLRKSAAGFWELPSGNAIWIEHDAASGSVLGYYAGLTERSRESFKRRALADLALQGRFQEGVLDGTFYSRFADYQLSACTGVSRGAFPESFTVSISQDGAHLRGEVRGAELGPGCKVQVSVTPLQLTRLKPDGMNASGVKVATLTRESVLAAAAGREAAKRRREDLTGQWRSAFGDRISIEAEGKLLRARFTEISRHTGDTQFYTGGSLLFEGTWEHEGFTGSVHVGFDRAEAQRCRVDKKTAPSEGDLLVSDDGTTLEVEGDLNTLTDRCRVGAATTFRVSLRREE